MSEPLVQMFFDPVEENRFLREQVVALNERIQRAIENPSPLGTVLDVGKSKTTVVTRGQKFEVRTPFGITVEPSDTVHLDPERTGIVDVVENPSTTGELETVVSVLDDRHCEVATGSVARRVVLYHVRKGQEKPKEGDRVVLDISGTIIVRNVGQSAKQGPIYDTGVSWEDVRGQAEAVAQLRDAIEGPVVDRVIRTRYGVRRTKGALLAGPPGGGKTMLGKAAATALARLHGRDSMASGYQYGKGPELLDPMQGNTEANVRKLFANARAHYAAFGYPCVIFLDEGDALLGRRDNVRFHAAEKTVVPMFLTEMDGLDESFAFVIVATNRPDMLDPAITRDGRLDLKIYVGRPTRDGVTDILDRYLRNRPLDGMSVEEACALAADQLYDKRHALYVIRTKSGKGDRRLALGDLVSGAMCEGLVEKAIKYAIAREKAGDVGDGLKPADFAKAADQLCEEQRILSHTSDLAELTQSLRDDFRSIDRVGRGSK